MSDEQTHNLDGGSFEERVFKRFDAMDSRFDAMDSRFDAMDSRFDRMDGRFDRMDGRFDALESRTDAIEQRFEGRFDAVENRLERLKVQAEKRALETKPIWERALAELAEVKESVAEVDRKFDLLTEDVMKVRLEQRHIRHRVEHLELKKQP